MNGEGELFQLRPLTPHWAISVLLCFWNNFTQNFTLNYRRHKDRLWEEILQLTAASRGVERVHMILKLRANNVLLCFTTQLFQQFTGLFT